MKHAAFTASALSAACFTAIYAKPAPDDSDLAYYFFVTRYVFPLSIATEVFAIAAVSLLLIVGVRKDWHTALCHPWGIGSLVLLIPSLYAGWCLLEGLITN